MKQRTFYTELSYLIGIVTMALGTAMMTLADFGVSMVVAPAYLLHLKISQYLSFFSFGMAEYTLQAVLLIAMMLLLRKAKLGYVFSFVTAFVYGLMLDGFLMLLSFPGAETMAVRVLFYLAGFFITAFAVSLMFHTYLAPAVYELFVREVTKEKGLNVTRFKTLYDLASLLIAVVMSFLFFGLWHFEGVKLGTVLVALFNGKCIGMFTSVLEKHFVFKDRVSFLPRA